MSLASSERTSRWVSTTFDSLRIRHYRILWAGTLLSFLGFMMAMTAQNVVAYDLTGNNRAVGSVMFGQGLAMLALAPFGGAIADRMSKRLLLLICQSIIGFTMVSVALLLVADLLSIWVLAASSFVMGTMFSFLAPARQAFIGDLVPPERRGNAVALTQVAMNATRVIGPFLAGGLLAWSVIGSAGTFFFIAAIFILVVATMAQLPPTSARPRGGPGLLADVTGGFRYVAENRELRMLIIGFVLIVMMGFPYMVVLPAFTIDVLGKSTAEFGIIMGVSAVGGLVVSLVFASLADSPKAPLLLTLATAGFGASLILTGLAPTFLLACVTMLGVGAGASGFQTLNNAIALRTADPAFYGRVMSLMMLAWSANGLIALPLGFLADGIGERATLVVMGTGVCAFVGLLAVVATKAAGRRPQPVAAYADGGKAPEAR